jgi:hypothetical protein
MEEKKEEYIPQELDNYFDYVTYLVGSMEKTAEGDGGQSKREIVEKELIARNIYPINPVRLEAAKTGTDTEDLTKKMKGWIASGSWIKFKEASTQIWRGKTFVNEQGQLHHVPGDIDYVKLSDWITFTLQRGDSPCGSYAECGIAMEHNIPIYLITDMPKKELRQSLIQMIEVTEGEVFSSVAEYLTFIDKKYELKKKE